MDYFSRSQLPQRIRPCGTHGHLSSIYITPAIGDRSRGGLLIYYGCSHTPEGRRNVGHEYVTEIEIFPIFFSTGKGGNGHTHSTPQRTAPNYPKITPKYFKVPQITPNYPKITPNYHKVPQITPKLSLNGGSFRAVRLHEGGSHH